MNTLVAAVSVREFAPGNEAATDPIALFRSWMAEASASELNDPNAMALATSTADGHPSVRMVLMKTLDERGFGFFTNMESQKGRELAANPYAAACFHWKSQRRQVRIAGRIVELPAEDSDRYFHSRSRGSQIGAAASHQSRPLASREALDAAAREVAGMYPGEIPRPVYWRGHAIAAETIEFWQDGADRLHDRVRFTRDGDGWARTRLYP